MPQATHDHQESSSAAAKDSAAEDSAAQTQDAAAQDAQANSPKRSKKKKKKRKSLAPLRDVQNAEQHLGKAALRMSRAVSEGLAAYQEQRQHSVDKKPDDVLWDFPRNAAEGMAVTLEKGSRVPIDIARAMDSKTAKRAVRLGTKILLWPLRR